MARLQKVGWVVVLCALCSQGPRAMQAPAAQKPELILQSAQTTVNQLAFSPDGRLLASGGMNDNAVHLWEVATGFQVRNLEAAAGGDFGVTGVTTLAFGPGNRYVAAGYFDGSATVWEVATGRKVRDFDGPPGDNIESISSLSFDRDEKLLIGTTNQKVRIWDLGSGNERTEGSQALCYGGLSSSGKELISLEIAQPSAKEMQKAQKDMLNRMMKGQSGGTFPGSAGATDLVLKDVNSGRQTTKKTVTGVGQSRSQGMCAVATTDGRILIPTVTNNTVQIVDGLSGGSPRVLTSPDPFSGGPDFALALTPDGRSVALAVGTAVTVWDGSRTTPLYVKRIDTGRGARPDQVTATAFSPDGRLLAVGSQASGILVCERATGREIARFSGGANVPFSVGFAAMGRRLFAGERTRWDLDSGRAEKVSAGPFSIATAISEDGRTLAIGHADGPEVEIWDATQKTKVSALAPSGTSRVVAVGLSRDGKLAAVTYQSPPKLAAIPATNNPMDLLAGIGIDPSQMMMGQRPPAKGKGKPGAAPGMPDMAAVQKMQEQMLGQVMNTVTGAGGDGLGRQIKIFETASGKELTTLTHPASVLVALPQSLEFSPDDKRVAVSYRYMPDPFVFDVATGSPVVLGPPMKSQPATPGVPQALADLAGDTRVGARQTGAISFSPDGRQMAVPITNRSEGFAGTGRVQPGRRPQNRSSAGATGSGLVSGPIEIWDVASVRKTSEVVGHPDGTLHAVFSADGKTLATSSFEQHDISIWDVATGREIRKVGRITSMINALALSPDGKLLAAGAFDGATRLYDTTKAELIATLLSINDGGDWLVVTADGLFDGSPAAWNKILWRFSQNTFDVAPVEVFFNEYYYPDLLADLVAGKRPKAKADLAQKDRRQAEVKLELPGVPASGDVSARDVTLKVHVTKAPAGARDVRLFRNGSLVKIWHGDAAATADFEAKVPIVAGANRFTAYVFNTDNVKSTDAVAEVTGADSLKRRGIGYVVAVGVNEYENPDYNLKFAVADADSFSADVKTQLEKQNRFERVEVTRLVDRSATKANILKTIGDLAKKVQPEDEVLLFVASHGTAAADRFYVIPSDLGYTGKRTELDEKSVETILAHSISDQELEAAFEGMNAGRLLLVIDACNSGQALEAEEKRRGPMNSKGLAQLAYEKGMYVLTASQSFQAAQEVSQLGHGLLTYALVTEGLDKGDADDEPKDGKVAAREWLDFATGRVPKIQLEKMEEARTMGRSLKFGTGARGDSASDAEALQHPRVFYRRELDDALWIVGTPK